MCVVFSLVVPVITAVADTLASVVSVFHAWSQRRVISRTCRRVGLVMFLVALTAWFVWLLAAIGLVSWKAGGIVVELPW